MGANSEELVVHFWKKNKHKIYSWYLEQCKSDDIVISASPEFLLKPICDFLGIEYLIVSKVSCQTGKFETENCYGVEKVKRLKHEFPTLHMEDFCSDSISDSPLAKLADRAYIIVNGQKKIWVIKNN